MRKPRLKGLAQEDYERIEAELVATVDWMCRIANEIGPAYGAPWCDKALKLSRAMDMLRLDLAARFSTQARLAAPTETKP